LRFALRQIARRPLFAFVTVGILGLGIGANAAVFRVVDGALLRPLPMPEEESLVFATDRQGDEGGFPPSWPEYKEWRRDGGSIFSSLAAFAGNGYVVQYPEGPEQVIAGTIAGDFLQVLGVSPLAGRGFDAAELQAETHVLMLSEEAWRRRFRADPGVVGKTLVVDEAAHTIIGVMPRAADILVNRRNLALWKPLILPERFRDRRFHLLLVAGRLQPGVPLTEARGRAGALGRALMESNDVTHGAPELASVRETLVGDSRTLLLALQGAVLFLLLIVCANLTNLYLLQSAARGREFAIRAAIGAGRLRLVRQLLSESMVLGILGGLVGVLLAPLAVGLVTAIAGDAGSLTVPSPYDARLTAFTFLLAVGTALLFGLLPAIRAGQSGVTAGLKSGDPSRAGRDRFHARHRKVLVAAELALSLVLLCASALMIRSVARLLREDPGFQPDQVLTFAVGLSPTRYPDSKPAQFYDELLSRIRALPEVRSAAAVSHLPLGGDDTNGGFVIIGRSFPEGEGPTSKKRIATPGYFAAMGIPMLRGRDFDKRDRADGRQVVIISRAVAERYWPGEDPLGREINFSWGPGDRHEIVGIAGDVRHDGLDIAIEGAIYRPLAQFPRQGMSVVIRASGDPLALVPSVREAARQLDPLQPLALFASMESVIGQSVGARRTLMVLLSVFAGIALVLAAVGVYTVTSQSVSQRRREIGVRMAVGARGGDVLRMVLREELAVAGGGILAGLAAAGALTRVLAASLYGISPRDTGTYVAVAALLAAIALSAILIPAIRASRVDPVVVLRND
jgi:predicted permease